MIKNQRNDKKGVRVKSSAEIIFRRELALLSDPDKQTRRILDHFLMYTHSIKELEDINESDQALLWLVRLTEEVFMAREQDIQNNLQDLNVYLRRVYRFLSLERGRNFLFPETKKEILRIIMEQWDVQKCDECGQEVFSFIWGRYDFENPPEERKIIDILFMERLDKAKPEDVEKWMKWVATISRRSEETTVPMFMQEYLARHLVLARARGSNFNAAMQDIRNNEIVNTLNIADTPDDLLHATHNACYEVKEFKGVVISFIAELRKNFISTLLGQSDEISYSVKSADIVEIFICCKSREISLMSVAKSVEEYVNAFFSPKEGRGVVLGVNRVYLKIDIFLDKNRSDVKSIQWPMFKKNLS